MGQSTSLHAALLSCPSAFPPTKALADPSTVLTPQLAFQPLPHGLNLPPGWLPRWSWWCNGVRTPQPGCRDPQWAPPWPSTSSPKSPTSQREGPVSSCQPYTVGGLLLGLFHRPPQNASDQRAKLGWGVGWGGGRCKALTNQVDPPILLLPASTALYGGSADQGPRRQLCPRSPRSSMEFEHWTLAA